MDNLEKHIKNNRAGLDIYEPSPLLWKKVRKRLVSGRNHVKAWLSVAAILVFVIGTALVVFTINRNNDDLYNAGSGPGNVLKEAEIYYATMVNNLCTEAAPLLNRQPEIKKELTSGMAHIDSICIDLKKDLNDNIDNQDVIEALIQNYRIKIQLLEEMLILLKKNENNTEKIKSHEM